MIYDDISSDIFLCVQSDLCIDERAALEPRILTVLGLTSAVIPKSLTGLGVPMHAVQSHTGILIACALTQLEVALFSLTHFGFSYCDTCLLLYSASWEIFSLCSPLMTLSVFDREVYFLEATNRKKYQNLCLFFSGRISLCSTSCPGFCYVDQAAPNSQSLAPFAGAKGVYSHAWMITPFDLIC